MEFLEAAQLDWAGFFTYSKEEGTASAGRDAHVAPELALDRLREVSEIQDAISARRRDTLVGTRQRVLVEAPGRARSVRECPEIDGVIVVDEGLAVGAFVDVEIVESRGMDLVGAVR